MTDQWHLARDGQTYGPYTWIDLCAYARAGNVAPGDLLWSPTSGGWVRADQVAGLFAAPAVSEASSMVQSEQLPTQPTAATAQMAARPRKRRGVLWLVATLVMLAVAGGAAWFFWPRSAGPGKDQTVEQPTPASVTPPAADSEAFWQSAELDASIAAMDDGDWSHYADLAEEQAAIDVTLTGFAEAMQAGDLDAAVEYILPERQEAYRELFATNSEGMASFGELLAKAEMSFLSEQTETTPFDRTAEYALDVDGFTFYLVLIKTDGNWVLYDF